MIAKRQSGTIARLVLLTLLAYAMPVVLLTLRVLPFDWRFRTLEIITALLALYAWRRGWSLRELGLRTDTLRGSLWLLVPFSIALAVAMWVADLADLIRPPTAPTSSLFYIHYVLVSSPAQEFLYRSFYFHALREAGVRRPWHLILITAANYAFMHLVYRDALTVLVTFAVGIGWGFIYERYPNWYAVAISHAFLGLLSIFSGLI